MEGIVPVLREGVNGEETGHYACLRRNLYRPFADLEPLRVLIGPFRKRHDGWKEAKGLEPKRI